ncbi:Mitochondrial distribution and morphology protein 35 [Kickxella alabastrina]|uniref:Mitochondrial distribution and morphology protein 35 n=1 Tax=Kickxella alabastrina TaxID=61397 RepID=A0ACC1IH52_9FUNG|nr:Mitochondrial distribution and morphology protein 35 [Kickxella alabastrina]
MDSIGDECTPLKREYDACFTKWYSEKFLNGERTNDCTEVFKKYQTCLRKVLGERGLTKMIDDARPSIGSVFANDSVDNEQKKSNTSK